MIDVIYNKNNVYYDFVQTYIKEVNKDPLDIIIELYDFFLFYD